LLLLFLVFHVLDFDFFVDAHGFLCVCACGACDAGGGVVCVFIEVVLLSSMSKEGDGDGDMMLLEGSQDKEDGGCFCFAGCLCVDAYMYERYYCQLLCG
jgi:hypothetical protein